jgi:fibronectin type 3 domain-containing protein
MTVVSTSPSSAQPVTIADTVEQQIESPHPYRSVWSQTLHFPSASFISIHVAKLDLAPGDRLELTDPAGRYRHVYTGRGRFEDGKEFWALSILGDTMIVTLQAQQSAADHDHFGVAIDRWTHGYPPIDVPEPDALCGAKDFRDVECYRTSYPTEFDKSRAVVRLIKSGSAHCTGWLASCQNHIVTNEHCVASQAELNTIEFQFDYKKPGCNSGTATVGLQLAGGTLLQTDAPLDYALIMPALAGNDPQATYGFLQWDKDRLPANNERIYIPQHPNGVPKVIGLDSTDTVHDQSGKCEVWSTTEPACSGGPPDVGYYCDTEGGSSGSPVLSGQTHKVVALHHCANCPNRGVPIQNVWNDIQASSTPLPGCSVCDPGAAPTNLVSTIPANNRVDLTWTGVGGTSQYRVYRSITSCSTDLQQIATTTTPSYVDTTVSGGRTYYYRVTAVNGCGAESTQSNCTQQTATGNCVDPPTFAGLDSATTAKQSNCAIDLAWSTAVANCGNQVRYNVYRSLSAGFIPSASNRIARCVNGLTFRDSSPAPGFDYHYVVRAEDDVSTGSGPCGGGNEDSNAIQRSSQPTGPDLVFFTASFEVGSSGWNLEGEWQIGAPQGRGGSAAGGSGAPDPISASAGSQVLGTDLSGLGSSLGNYEDNIATQQYATSPTFSATGRTRALVRFRRWLGVEKGQYDIATVDGYDGTAWTTVWQNQSGVDLNDGAWTAQEIDATSVIAGRSNARLRWGIKSDASVKFCGWNIDALEVYEPGTCVAGSADVHPVPDGRWAPGAMMLAQRAATEAEEVNVQWDVSSCPVEIYHLLYGDSAGVATYDYDGGVCGLPLTGSATIPIPRPAPGHATWWTIVAVDGTTEAPHGYRSNGTPRSATGSPLCGILSQDSAASCP